jgi:ABC-2 type transport system ATP-binding protein
MDDARTAANGPRRWSDPGGSVAVEVRGLTKRYGDRVAVETLSFTVRPGLVTGFLGPNGAGKSTTLRMILGLDAPTAGTATIAGAPMRALRTPMRTVGSLLDARAVHPRRSAFDHLLALAQAGGVGAERVSSVLDRVGLAEAAHRPAGDFSLGMGQRLGIATALLGDPAVLIFDEPINGLDPEGIRWVRTLMRDLAAEGRTVLFSSHLMSEMELTADHLVVIGQGRLLADAPLQAFVREHTRRRVIVRSADRARLRSLLRADGHETTDLGHDGLTVGRVEARRVGELAAREGLVLDELTTARDSLEDVFLRLTRPGAGRGAVAA